MTIRELCAKDKLEGFVFLERLSDPILKLYVYF